MKVINDNEEGNKKDLLKIRITIQILTDSRRTILSATILLILIGLGEPSKKLNLFISDNSERVVEVKNPSKLVCQVDCKSLVPEMISFHFIQ